MDAFKKEFKRYKQRKPPPDLSDVIDFDNPGKWSEKISCVELNYPGNRSTSDIGLKKVEEWKAYFLTDFPGFLFITNPFSSGAQWRLVKQCLKVYSCKPNISNLDAHMEVKYSIWDTSSTSDCLKSSLLYKLRWVTLGYHYDWNAKTYSEDAHSDFPTDLSVLSTTIAEILGFKNFTPEAGIINYYHLDSTLGGHTDHSEFDLTAPLFSISLGQSSIFLLGGKTRDVVPVAMYMRSGDIMVMAGDSRLAYHAVPRILAPTEERLMPLCLEPSVDLNSPTTSTNPQETSSLPPHPSEEEKGNQLVREEEEFNLKRTKYECEDISSGSVEGSEMTLLEDRDFRNIREYLSSSRININIRQVLATGQTFPREPFY